MLPLPRVRLLPTLTVLLSLIGLACGGGDSSEGPPEVAQPEALLEMELAAYKESSFNTCDVKVLSAFWGSLELDTKSMISAKILDGGEPLVSEALGVARAQALSAGEPTCSIEELGYTPADAQAVADNWNYDLSEAKAAMFNKYLNVGKAGLAEEVERSHGVALERANMAEGEDEGQGQAPMEAVDAFFEFSDMCEAKMLMHLWGQSIVETKERIGAKHLAGQEELLSEEVYRAYQDPSTPRCQWPDVAYGYEDAVVLAKYWGMSVDDTKATMVSKIQVGNRSYLQQELGAAYRD